MKVLFDQGTPVPLRRQLVGHEIKAVYERGWATLKNGDLLSAATLAPREAVWDRIVLVIVSLATLAVAGASLRIQAYLQPENGTAYLVAHWLTRRTVQKGAPHA